jgi:hypothetical protein
MKWVAGIFGLFMAGSTAYAAMDLTLRFGMAGLMPYTGIAAFVASVVLLNQAIR